MAEPRIQPVPTGIEKRVNDSIERIASVATTVVAALLVVFVGIAIIGVVAVAWKPLVQERDFMRAAVAGLDAAFVAIILLELVHTTLSRGPISNQIQEFLVIGITSAVRSGLETAAGHGNARDTAIVLAITSGAALILVAALWLLRQRLSAEKTDNLKGDGKSDEGDDEEGAERRPRQRSSIDASEHQPTIKANTHEDLRYERR